MPCWPAAVRILSLRGCNAPVSPLKRRCVVDVRCRGHPGSGSGSSSGPVQPGYQAVDVAMGTVVFPHLAHDQGHLLGYRRQDAVFDKRSAARSITHMGIAFQYLRAVAVSTDGGYQATKSSSIMHGVAGR